MTNCQERTNHLETELEPKSNHNITYIKKSEVTTVSHTEEQQEIKNSLLYKELNKSKDKRNLENIDKYLIILGAITLAEQKPRDLEHRHWIEQIILKQLRTDLDLKQKFEQTHFNIIRNLEEKDTRILKEELKSKIQSIRKRILLKTLNEQSRNQ